jgi:hypothetical protein
MADTPETLAAEAQALKAREDQSAAKLVSALQAAVEAERSAIAAFVAEQAVLSADHLTLADRIRALPVGTPAWTPRFPGDTAPGTIRWGAGGGNDSARAREHEAAAGVPMGYWRLFYQMSEATAAVAKCREGIAAKRVPKLSMKPGMSWADVAAGKLDAALRTLFLALAPLPGPVHFILHHEPEGGGGSGNSPDDPGGAPAWRAMQARVRKVLDASGAKNIAFAPCLMAYTWSPQSGRNPDDWWVPDVWDFYSADLYQSTESGPAPVNNVSWLNFVAWAERRNIPVALGELGNRGSDATAGAELRETYEFLCQIDCVGSTYFDTSLNSGPAPYTLVGEPLKVFRELMKDKRSVHL